MSGLRLFTVRNSAGEPVLDAGNGEELVHVKPAVSLVLGNHLPLCPGTLYITTRQVVWLSDTDKERGYAVDFFHISLHAVSRDPEAYPSPCLYAQIDIGDEDDDLEGTDSEHNETLDLSKITEMRLVPSDPNQVEELFQFFCECAELNPEPIEEEEEQEHNWIFSAEQLENETADEIESEWMNSSIPIGCSNGDDLSHAVLQLQVNDNRFEDAEEMDSDDINQHRGSAT
ncbi:unnamed protein product [Cuscuta epithymum]|uniref:Chloride conductance regulatory protein ICln n=1 Tax=Cuscuta epithymum TaxID=186058 RepID=A0AAV0FWQ3_9ASTE|nr:unnamed protein product [Cuscuta epithymum]